MALVAMIGWGAHGAGTASTAVEGLQVNHLVGEAANVGARPVFS